MDITVERLNNRLAMRLPAELPLGLVFVTGTLVEMATARNGRDIRFTLEEMGHRIRCVWQDGARTERDVRPGTLMRAGGHLAFDPLRADYFLLARDVDVIGAVELPPDDSVALELDGLDVASATTTPILTELNRRAAVNGLAPADMPAWVTAMAPEVVKAEMSTAGAPSTPAAETTAVDPQPSVTLDPELVAAISAALDRGEDVELTREFLDQYTAPDTSTLSGPTARTHGASAARETPVRARSQRGNSWILAMLLLNLIFLTVVVAAIVYVLFF